MAAAPHHGSSGKTADPMTSPASPVRRGGGRHGGCLLVGGYAQELAKQMEAVPGPDETGSPLTLLGRAAPLIASLWVPR